MFIVNSFSMKNEKIVPHTNVKFFRLLFKIDLLKTITHIRLINAEFHADIWLPSQESMNISNRFRMNFFRYHSEDQIKSFLSLILKKIFLHQENFV